MNSRPRGGSKARECPFCADKREPDYKDYETLRSFVTDRARIVSRTRSSLCAKHQRSLAREVKRARHLALLPFSVKI